MIFYFIHPHLIWEEENADEERKKREKEENGVKKEPVRDNLLLI